MMNINILFASEKIYASLRREKEEIKKDMMINFITRIKNDKKKTLHNEVCVFGCCEETRHPTEK